MTASLEVRTKPQTQLLLFAKDSSEDILERIAEYTAHRAAHRAAYMN